MKKIIRTFIKYPFYANIVVFVLLIGGTMSLMNMKKSFFPERASRMITVQVSYPGASPKEMEEGITSRIEESIRGVVGIKEITSTSSENFARVSIETTGEYELDVMLTEVKNAVDGISSLPSAAERPIVYKQRSVTQASRIGIFGDVDLMTLKKYAQQVEEDFLSSGIISQVSVQGYPPIEISVEATEQDLLRYGVTFDEISRAIAINNTDISGGQIKSDEEEILIRSRNRSVDANKIGDIILRGNNDGSFLRVRDIANVKMKFADVSSDFKINGKTGISITVNKLIEEDLDEISEFVDNYIEEFNKKHDSVQLKITFNFLDILSSRLDLLYNNGGLGLILVIISLALFLSFRLSLWVAWGIPAAFLAMFMLANAYGVTINMVSLFGMILVIGILVDDGIVIGENIYSHFEAGKTPRKAALDGTMEVLPAVITSVLTTIIAFSPLLLIKQGGLEFMFEMAFVVIFSLLFSLLEAFFVLPAHLANEKTLHRSKKVNFGTKVRDKLEQFIGYMRENIYGKLLKLLIKWRWIFIFIPIALILITVGLFKGGVIQATFFPAMQFDYFGIDFAFQAGEGEKQTKEYLAKFDDIVWEMNDELKEEFKDTTDFVTFTFQSLGSAFQGMENGAHAANIFVTLKDMEGAPISSFEVIQRLQKKIGKVPEIDRLTIGGTSRWGYPVSISLQGRITQELDSAKVFLETELAKLKALNNVFDNNAKGKQEVLIDLKPKAYFLGLNHASISNQIRQGFYGDQSQRLQNGRDEVRVWVRYPKSDRLSMGQLEQMKIKTAMGDFPLSELVDYRIERGPVSIKRLNGKREVTVNADLVNQYDPVPPILAKIEKDIFPVMKARYPGISYLYQGQQKRSAESMGEITSLFGIAFMIIILVLMIHFKSAKQAIFVIMMIPLGWLGALWGHGIEGIPVSMLSAWGMVALSGVIINDAVVFLQRFNDLLTEGYKVEEAVYTAGKSRFRAILLTTVTTVVGLYPLILEDSMQAQFLIPMAVALAYGVFVGTAFILTFFPVIILIANDITFFLKSRRNFEITPEEVEVAIINSKIKMVDEE